MADKKISDLTAASSVAGTDVVPVVQTAGGADDPKKATVTQVLAPHAGNTSNPHAVTKAQVGLGNVQNVDQTNADNLTTGTVADARIAPTIARDSEVSSAVAAEASARDVAIAVAIANLIASAPGALDTLNEIAAALNNDANFAATMTTALAGKQPLNSGLTTIAGLVPVDNDFLQRKAGVWVNRSPGQAKTDLALTKSDVGLGSVPNIDTTNDYRPGSANISAAGLTGATAASRYVGATASGAPTSGTFAVGDFIIDQTGIMWICTAAGTPGTWVDASSTGKELGYSEITSNATTTNIGFANRVDATGLIVTVTIAAAAAGQPIMVEFWGEVANTTVNNGASVYLVENVAGNANNTPVLTSGSMTSAGVAGAGIPDSVRVRLAPSAGSHTYKVMISASVGGTAGVFCSATQPAFLAVTKR